MNKVNKAFMMIAMACFGIFVATTQNSPPDGYKTIAASTLDVTPAKVLPCPTLNDSLQSIDFVRDTVCIHDTIRDTIVDVTCMASKTPKSVTSKRARKAEKKLFKAPYVHVTKAPVEPDTVPNAPPVMETYDTIIIKRPTLVIPRVEE